MRRAVRSLRRRDRTSAIAVMEMGAGCYVATRMVSQEIGCVDLFTSSMQSIASPLV